MTLQKIHTLRKELHQNPELSGLEENTANRIVEFVAKYHPSQILKNIEGHGVVVVYEFPKPGNTVAIRCELDALPIQEENTFQHASKTEGVSHKCGHDGHMAIVAGLAPWIAEQNFAAGKIILLFQPAEETGKGAYKMLQDTAFQTLKPDYLFALHNIPQEPLHEIIVLENGFSAEVISFKVELKGVESHAAEPEKGKNPSLAISEMVQALSKLNVEDPMQPDFAILTSVCIEMGQKSYGISPANGELHYTIRTWNSEAMQVLQSHIESVIAEISKEYHLQQSIDWFEYFPACSNESSCVEIVKKAAKSNQYKIQERAYPFKFGEDFGWFSKDQKVAMFGIGAGKDTYPLHHPKYDFPEALIETGMEMFKAILLQILK